MQNILNKTILVAHRNNSQLEHRGLHSVYRNFDTLRGMNYRMHLSFYDRGRLKHVFNSIEVVKPIGRIEIAPSPYVHDTEQFFLHYEKTCMDNTFLMLFSPLTNRALTFNDRHKHRTRRGSTGAWPPIIVNDTSYPAPYLLLGPPGLGKTATLVVGIGQISMTKPNSKILAMPT
ncbi:hypothetical protein quinque_015811 [Culex quinquefasciatus]